MWQSLISCKDGMVMWRSLISCKDCMKFYGVMWRSLISCKDCMVMWGSLISCKDYMKFYGVMWQSLISCKDCMKFYWVRRILWMWFFLFKKKKEIKKEKKKKERKPKYLAIDLGYLSSPKIWVLLNFMSHTCYVAKSLTMDEHHVACEFQSRYAEFADPWGGPMFNIFFFWLLLPQVVSGMGLMKITMLNLLR